MTGNNKLTQGEINRGLQGYRNWLSNLSKKELVEHREWVEWVISQNLLRQVFGESDEKLF